MRHTRVEIEVAGTDATESIAPFLLKFSYSDSIDKKSDSVSITLYDHDWRHLRQWVLPKGTEIKAKIIQVDDQAGETALETGKLETDDITFKIGSGGSTLDLKANSVPVKGKAKGSKKFKAWEGADLKTINEQVAGDSGLEVVWEVESGSRLSRVDQDGETDLQFLQRLADENGHSMKVADGKVIIFDEEKYEQREPWIDLAPGTGAYDDLTLKTTATGKFGSAEASWTSPRTGKTVKEKFTPQEPPEGAGGTWNDFRRYNRDGENDEDESDSDTRYVQVGNDSASRSNEYEWQLASGNVAEQSGKRKGKGKSKAAKELRKANKDEWTCSFKAPGDVRWGAGQTFTLSQEFGKFGRKYICKSVTHEVGRDSGYTCSVSAHGTLKGY